jgi:DAACS family dicarboxylate/amino acid:cation (Na+ or H+) symporter
MFFALFVGLALTLARSETTESFEKWLQGLYEVVMKIISIAMKFAPYGVAALVFSAVAKLGLDMIVILGKYMIVVLAALSLQQFGVYALILKFLVRVSPLEFYRRIKEVMLTAFSTSSSNVTLPTALRTTENQLGVPPKISRFVLTLGSTANQNGTALFEGITVLFLAQFFGVDLSFAEQITVVLASILAGIGTAGVPGGSLPVIVLLLQSVGIPGEGIGIIIGVDRVLDMSRTVVNVTGDITAAMVVAKGEGAEVMGRKYEV